MRMGRDSYQGHEMLLRVGWLIEIREVLKLHQQSERDVSQLMRAPRNRSKPQHGPREVLKIPWPYVFGFARQVGGRRDRGLDDAEHEVPPAIERMETFRIKTTSKINRYQETGFRYHIQSAFNLYIHTKHIQPSHRHTYPHTHPKP